MGLECDFTDYALLRKKPRRVTKSYIHNVCNSVTELTDEVAAAFAKNPAFLDYVFCVDCCGHYPAKDFIWNDGTKDVVGETGQGT